MNELSVSRRWVMGLYFTVLSFGIIFLHLLPLDTLPARWVMPDLLMGFAFAWTVRRPEYVPVLLLSVVFLMADLLLQRPPGLWAFLMLVACESLKAQIGSLRVTGFPVEWLTVAGMILGVTLAYRLILSILLVEMPGFGLALMQMGFTILIYPVIAGVTHAFMGVRKSNPGDLDTLGDRA